MLSPETWNFKPSQHNVSVLSGSCDKIQKVLTEINYHHFNHSVSIILPDTVLVPEDLNSQLIKDSTYYKITNFSIGTLLDKQFIEAFVKSGKFSGLSIGTHIDTDDCAAVTPTGHLVLNLQKETYQTLGLQGVQSKYSSDRYDGAVRSLDTIHYGVVLASTLEGVLGETFKLLSGPLRTLSYPFKNILEIRKSVTMPQRHQVKRLEVLAMRAVGEWIKTVARGLAPPAYEFSRRDPNQAQLLVLRTMASVRELLAVSVPWYLHDQMTQQVLISVCQLVDETKSSYSSCTKMAEFLNNMRLSVGMAEIVLHSRLKKLDVSKWPKIIRHVLNQNLNKLVGLEELNMGSGSGGWDTRDTENHILSGIEVMTKLTKFVLCYDCTNVIINVLGNNCPSLQVLDVFSSRAVNDRSISSLLNCKQLREIKLAQTSITVDGFCELLKGLPHLQDIGRYVDFGRVLEMLHEENLIERKLELLSMECRDMTEEQLKLLIVYCPQLSSISIYHSVRVVDLTIFSNFSNLRDLKILNCDFFTDYVKNLLEKHGTMLNSLHLEHVEEINLNALIYISQRCPNLKALYLHNCEFSGDNLLDLNMKKLPIPPFGSLERLICVSDCSTHHLKFLLTHSCCIRYVQLGSSTGIDDDTITSVLRENPMSHLEELKILHSEGLSMTTVRLLMDQCQKLRTLSELESWCGITNQELFEFREYLRKNNYNLDTRPTLSQLHVPNL